MHKNLGSKTGRTEKRRNGETDRMNKPRLDISFKTEMNKPRLDISFKTEMNKYVYLMFSARKDIGYGIRDRYD